MIVRIFLSTSGGSNVPRQWVEWQYLAIIPPYFINGEERVDLM